MILIIEHFAENKTLTLIQYISCVSNDRLGLKNEFVFEYIFLLLAEVVKYRGYLNFKIKLHLFVTPCIYLQINFVDRFCSVN